MIEKTPSKEKSQNKLTFKKKKKKTKELKIFIIG